MEYVGVDETGLGLAGMRVDFIGTAGFVTRGTLRPCCEARGERLRWH